MSRFSQRFSGHVAVITGASAGIGRATARLLGENGVRLVLNARRLDRLAEVAEPLGATAVDGDITDPAVRARVVEACRGRCDILVNNAGYGEPGPVEVVSEEDARRQFEVNLFAPAFLAQAVLPLMRKQRSGHIIQVSSVAGRLGYPLFGWYCATKHALEGLSDALRIEVSPWDIHVVLIEPGPVRTEFFEVTKAKVSPQMTQKASPYVRYFDAVDDIERDFMKQATTPEKIAQVIVKACAARRPRSRYAVTAMAKATVAVSKFLPRRLLDWVCRRQFRIPRAAEVD